MNRDNDWEVEEFAGEEAKSRMPSLSNYIGRQFRSVSLESSRVDFKMDESSHESVNGYSIKQTGRRFSITRKTSLRFWFPEKEVEGLRISIGKNHEAGRTEILVILTNASVRLVRDDCRGVDSIASLVNLLFFFKEESVEISM